MRASVHLPSPWPVIVLALLACFWLAGALSAQPVVINEIYYHPTSEDAREEFIELLNTGPETVELTGWRLSKGVDFIFPIASIPAQGFLVVAADVAVFRQGHPEVASVVGGWQGTLKHRGETIRLDNSLGAHVDEVAYADEGDWAVRQRGPLDFDHRGWVWQAAHDGGGKSLELINPALNHNAGQNWQSSRADGGTPGRPNSVANADVPPLILEVQHHPAVPRSTESVRVTARIEDEHPEGLAVTLLYRLDGASEFTATPMLDDGAHADGLAADGVFGAFVPPQAQDTVVEFYLRATNASGHERFWPAWVQPENAPLANLLYQVDDRVYDSAQPFYRLIMTGSERTEFVAMVTSASGLYSDAAMNGTFISSLGPDTEVRYQAGIRNRGGGTRYVWPNNFRVDFPSDQLWHGVTKIKLNAHYPFAQLAGSSLCQLANITYTRSRAVQVRLNNVNLALSDYPMYGFYVHNENLDGDFTDRRALGPVNCYRGIRASTNEADLTYRGDNPDPYRAVYAKQTNVSEDDWTDLIQLTRVLSSTAPEADYTRAVDGAVNVDEWLRFFALNTLFENNETSLGSGYGDDYALYRDRSDGRFVLVPYDLDTILGQGDTPGSPTASLFRATRLPTLERFLLSPEYVPRYYGQLLDLSATTFAATNLNPVLEQVLKGAVPDFLIANIQSFAALRSQFIVSQIPRRLTVLHDLPTVQGLPFTDRRVMTLHGVADAVRTRQVRVNGTPASWSAWEAKWVANDLPLVPGIDHILVQSLDTDGVVFDQLSLDIRCDPSQSGLTLQGPLAANSTWEATLGPYRISGEVVVPPGITLIIRPGTTLFFSPGAALTVRGRLLAEGTESARIRLARPPEESGRWAGLRFLDTTLTNRLAFCDLEFADGIGPSITVSNAPLELQGVAWSETTGAALVFDQASVRAEDCAFPATVNDDEVRGRGMLPGGVLLFQRNTFPQISGGGQAIRFDGGASSGAVLQCFDNRFLGGHDAAILLTGADAHVEGNRFEHFQEPQGDGRPGAALSAASDGTHAPEVVAARNLFADNDRALLIRSSSFLTAHNNTFVRCGVAGIAFAAPPVFPEPGRGAELIGNIFYAIAQPLAAADSFSPTNLLVEACLFPEGLAWPGLDNLAGDPLWAPPALDFLLLPGSPAKGSGRNGLDMGYAVPAGVVVRGLPASPTPARQIRLRVWGPGIAHYRYRLDDRPLQENIPVTQTLILTNLTVGPHTMVVQGRTQIGTSHTEAAPVTHSWVVDANAPAVLLSEICAWNVSSVPTSAGYPDWIEIRNRTENAVDLSGMSLSNEVQDPRRFVFPPGTVLAPEDYLVLYGGAAPHQASFLSLGFSLSRAGETVYLFDSPTRGGQLLDSVRFGYQLPDLSIGRLEDGRWHLTQPTPGTDNRLQPTGDSSRIKINEWQAGSSAPGPLGFIELYNPDPLPAGLEGLFLSDDPVTRPWRFALPPLSFVAGRNRITLWEDDPRAETAFRLNFNLTTDQGCIGLSRADGASVDRVWYAPLPAGVARGRNPDGASTIQSFALAGPGVANLQTAPASNAAPAVMVINEILADNRSFPDPGGAFPDWIELHNTSTAPVDISGMSLANRLDSAPSWTFPAGSWISGQGYRLVWCDPDQPASTNNTGFGLEAHGDAVYLFRPAREGGGILDGVEFGFQSPDLALGRDSANAWRPTQPTPAAANRFLRPGDPRDLRINEWMARPAAGEDWLEIFNGGAGPVDMGGLFLTDDLNPDAGRRIPNLSFIGTGYFGYREFIADGNPANGAHHLGFKLAATGEAIDLFDARGNVLDRIVFGPQSTGVSEGRLPDGSATLTSFPATPSPGGRNYLDTDGDGLPDAWELEQGLDPLDPRDARLDTDGDGFDNLAEFAAGTDPRDPRSRLTIESVEARPGGVTIRFTAIAGKSYSLQFSTAANGPSWNRLSAIKPRPASGTVAVVDPSATGAGTRFYRLVTP